jgi:uncharacterized protein YjbJ (UPF0337 family)
MKNVLALTDVDDVGTRACRSAARDPAVVAMVRVLFHRACRPPAGIGHQEHIMGINKNQVKGRFEEVKGASKQAAGKLFGDKKLEAKGIVEKSLGAAQANFGDAKRQAKKSQK